MRRKPYKSKTRELIGGLAVLRHVSFNANCMSGQNKLVGIHATLGSLGRFFVVRSMSSFLCFCPQYHCYFSFATI